MKTGQKSSWSNPTPGTVIDVPAGESVELLFTCNNDQQKVVTFDLETSGLGSWGEEKLEQAVAPFDTSNLSYRIQPEARAELGDYPFKVRISSGGDLVEPLGERELVLRVTEGKAAPVTEEPPIQAPTTTVSVADLAPEKPAAEKLEREKPNAERKPRSPAVKAKASVEPPPVVDEPTPPPVDEPFPEPEPEPIPEPEPEPESEPEPVPIELPEPPDRPEPVPDLPDPAPAAPSFFAEPEPEATAEPDVIYVETPKPEPKPEPKPVAKPEPRVVKVVDLDEHQGPTAWEQEEEQTKELMVHADHVFANPKEGTTLYARPGEKVLVRFSIKNEQSGVRTHVIQEDRSLPSDWIALVQDQVNITPGGSGDVSVILTPPIHADPAIYPFTLAYGILGQPLAPVYLQLCVQAAPAVKLKAKSATAGAFVPFVKGLEYQLVVESQGNADTAYRISVKDPLVERDEQGRAKGPDDLYETATWRYLFDREMDTLTSPSANREPTPEQHRMKLVRKGIWWLGWVEKHRMTVAARPVTDASNGGKPDNNVELVGKRWRIFPLPGFIMIPLAIVLLSLLGSGAANLRVTNGLIGEDGYYYVLGAKPDEKSLNVRLKWEAPVYAVLKGSRAGENQQSGALSMQRGQAADSVEVQGYGQAQKMTYQVGSKFTGSGAQAVVRLVPIKTVGMLDILSEQGQKLMGTPIASDAIGEDKVAATGKEITITVPKAGVYRLNFRNLTGTGGLNGQTIVLWTLRQPEGFQISDFISKPPDNNQVLNPGTTVTAKISAAEPGGPASDAVWELLTTEQNFQHLRIHLKVAE